MSMGSPTPDNEAMLEHTLHPIPRVPLRRPYLSEEWPIVGITLAGKEFGIA